MLGIARGTLLLPFYYPSTTVLLPFYLPVVRDPDAVVARDHTERGTRRRVVPEDADLLDGNVEHAPACDTMGSTICPV